jgi:hypothetical protein
MTLEEAVKHLYRAISIETLVNDPAFHNSVLLGIEALKALAILPPRGYSIIRRPLPGETEV